MPTFILRTTGAGDETNLAGTGTPAGGAVNWARARHDDADTSYVSNANPTTFVYDSYNVDDLPSTNYAISQVNVQDRCRVSGGAGVGDDKEAGVRLSSSNTMSASVQLNTTYTLRASNSLARPGGGSWSASDINSMQVRIGLRENGTQTSRCTEIYAEVVAAHNYELGSGTDDDAGTSVTATLSRTPAAGAGVMLAAFIGDPGFASTEEISSVSGAGLTWTRLQRVVVLGALAQELWLGKAESPTSGNLTLTLTGPGMHVAWAVNELPVPSGYIATAPQSASNSQFSGASLTVTLPNAFADATNHYAFGAFTIDGAATPGSGFGLISATGAVSGFSLATEFRVGQDLTVDMSAGTGILLGSAAEIGWEAISAPAIELDAIVGGSATASANLTTAITMAAQAAGTSQVTSGLATAITFAATLAGTAQATAGLATAIAFASDMAGTSALTAELETAITMAAQMAGSATLEAQFDVVAVEFAAVVSGSAAVTSSLLTEIWASATLAGSSATAADIETAIEMAAALAGSSEMSAPTLLVPTDFYVSMAGSSSMTAALSTSITMAATATGSTVLSASLLTGIPLTASMSGASSASAAITTSITMAASLAGSSSASASLQVVAEILLAANAAGSSSLSAQLTTAIALTAALNGDADMVAVLLTEILLAAQLSGTSSLTAGIEVVVFKSGYTTRWGRYRTGVTLASGRSSTGATLRVGRYRTGVETEPVVRS